MYGLFLLVRAGRRVVRNAEATLSIENTTMKPDRFFVPTQVSVDAVPVEEEDPATIGEEGSGGGMAYKILESCGCCGVCVTECPVQAISAGAETYVIDEALCVGCKGYYDEPACITVCPMDCIVKAP